MATLLVGHNIISFDLGVLHHFNLLGRTSIPVVDTLILSRLTDYNRDGGHSLGAWGLRFHLPKSEFNDFSQWSQELEDRCISDTEINLLLYKRFIPHLESPRWQRAIELEHKTQFLCEELKKNGFYFDTPSCIALRDNLYNTIGNLRDNFSKDFPPLVKPLREITPSVTTKGTLKVKDFHWLKEEGKELDLSQFTPLCPFTLIEYVPFNPGSPSQIVERLNSAGWSPVNKTKAHLEAIKAKDEKRLEKFKVYGWKVDNENLDTLPDVENLIAWKDHCRTKLVKPEELIKELITKGILKEKEQKEETTSIAIKNITEKNILKECTALLQQSLSECLKDKTDVAKFVESEKNLWSIIVTPQAVFVDCSASYATGALDGLKNDQELQQRISLLTSAKGLAKFLLLKSRLEDLNEWLAVVNSDNYIQGTFNGLGSWTHRVSHNSPNMANIPALYNRKGQPQPYGPEMRSMWLARPNHRLVGVDADGIQLRVFAHYVNSPELIKTIVSGRKEDKTDIHSLNQKIMGPVCRSRESAKTLIYALFLGAGIKKVQEILQCTLEEARIAVERIFDFYPGWRTLREERFPEDVKRGYFVGLDGRLVKFPGAHYLLAGYLQNGEAVIMKAASVMTNEILHREQVPYYFCNFVHDEEQYSVLDKDGLPEYVGQTAMDCIVQQGNVYELNCPLAANMKIGANWKDTH